MTLNYFYDTEFVDTGGVIDLISIGIVCEDGREYYAVSSEFDTNRVLKHSWLMDNVMNSIDHDVMRDFDGTALRMDILDEAAKPRDQIAHEIRQFIVDGSFYPQLWAWFGAYDHVALSQLWGRMIDLPSPMPMWTNDLKTLEVLYGIRFGQQPSGNHNALDDARFNLERWNSFKEHAGADQ